MQFTAHNVWIITGEDGDFGEILPTFEAAKAWLQDYVERWSDRQNLNDTDIVWDMEPIKDNSDFKQAEWQGMTWYITFTGQSKDLSSE